MKILIVGGSGGIGSALVQLFLKSHPEAIVYATYRTTKPVMDNPRLYWSKVDLSSEQQIQALSESIPELTILINAVGILHQPDTLPEKSIKEFNGDFFNHNMTSNVMPSIYLAKHFAKQLKAKQNSYLITISARIGSIEDNKIGGWISYRCSKAALNMALKTISVEWKYKLPNCCVFAFHPGTTDTNLSKQFQRNVPDNKLFTPEYVANCLANLISTKTAADSGMFFSYDGSKIPW